MRRIFSVGVLAGMALAACRGNDSPAGPNLIQQDLVAASQAGATKYIVVYNATVSDSRAEIARNVSAQGAKVERIYQYAIRGWSGDLSVGELARLRNDPHVAFIEQDGPVHTTATQSPTPSFGLDRIDQVSLPLNNSYTFSRTGAGVHFYGIDTGILYSHTDFGGRASAGFDAVTVGGNAVDCNGHGTHTASTAAGTTFGVAKAMTVIGVRVLDCNGSGTTSGVIAGIDWVTQNGIKPAVANLSLGGGRSAALDAAVAGSISSGVVYAIASGNSNADACGFSPADVPTALTVNASTITDARASFSNFGTCTDLFAPGTNITAAWIGSNTATNTISGTSMATPHVAGVVGQFLEGNRTATPAQVASAILGNASANKIINAGTGSPNRLLFMGFIGGASNQAPVARFTATCPTLQCTFDASSSTDDVGVVTYAWTWGDGRSESHPFPVTKSTFAVPGTYNVKLTVTDGGGLSNSITKSVQVPTPTGANQPPTAAITLPASNASFVQGTSVSFAGSGSDPETGALSGAALAWTSSRDGAIGSGTGFTKTTLSVGTHLITLTATDPQLATGTVTRTITITATAPVNQPPSAAISLPASNASFVQGTSVSFAGSGSDPETGALSGAALAWTSSRDGAIGTGTAFTKTTLSVGTHLITLTATDPQLATGTATRTITITAAGGGNQAPVAAFAVNCNTGVLHQCALDASSSTDDVGIVSYTWAWGDGRTETHAVPTSKNTWSTAGTFNVTLKVTDGGGLTSTITKAVAVP